MLTAERQQMKRTLQNEEKWNNKRNHRFDKRNCAVEQEGSLANVDQVPKRKK